MADNERAALLRLLDVNANRSMEALRTAEEYIRFFIEDRELTAQARRLRHSLGSAINDLLPDASHLAHRDADGDVGAGPTLDDPGARTSPADVSRAAFFRLKESVRALEEYGKTLSPEIARRFEAARYAAYGLEKETVLKLTDGSSTRERPAR